MVPYRLSTDTHVGTHLFWMVPYRLSKDAQIINKLSVETLSITIYG